MPGEFIVFEGGECSGKSTQSELLHKFLKEQNIPSMLVNNPGTTPLGDRVREIILNDAELKLIPKEELFLYLVGHSTLLRDEIIPAMEDERIVICDRYIDSTIAYQGYGSGLDREMVSLLCEYATDGITPQPGIYIDIPLSLMEERLGEKDMDKMEVRGVEFHKRVLEGFRKLADKKDYLHRIDGRGSVEEVFERVRELVERIVLR